MNATNQKQHIRSLISQGKIQQAFQELSNYSDDTVLLLQARYNRVKNDRYSGIIADNDYNVEMNRLVAAILNSLDNLSDESKTIMPLSKTN